MNNKVTLIMRIIVIIAVVLVIGQKCLSPNKDFAILETSEVTTDIYAVKGKIVNSFLIKNGDKYIAIDAGEKSDYLQSELKKINIDPNDVEYVLLTHSDYDHVGGLAAFSNAKIYLPADEVQMIDGTTKRFFSKCNKCDFKYETLNDNEDVTIDNITIKVISTKGHTPGSTSYLINDKFLFIGDALGIKKGEICTFPRALTMNMDQMIESIEKIKKIESVKVIFTSHFGCYNK